MITHYTLGFLFNPEKTKVVLIKKERPTWQAGRLNGIGGHVEKDETSLACMEREFKEEVDYANHRELNWRRYASLISTSFFIDCFAAIGDITSVKSVPLQEEVVILDLDKITVTRTKDLIENVPFLISMALDFLEDGRPVFSTIYYDTLSIK